MGQSVAMERTASAEHPFWFDLWRNRGWSSRVARNWQMDAAFRDKDRGFLDIVLPTLAPEQKTYVAGVLSLEGRPLGLAHAA